MSALRRLEDATSSIRRGPAQGADRERPSARAREERRVQAQLYRRTGNVIPVPVDTTMAPIGRAS